MAKTLPAIIISDSQYARVAAAIPGNNASEKIATYNKMVKEMLNKLVVENDIRIAREAAEVQVELARQTALTNPDNLS